MPELKRNGLPVYVTVCALILLLSTTTAQAKKPPGDAQYRLLNLPMIWLDIGSSNQRSVVSRESPESYEDRKDYLKMQLPKDHFTIVDIDPTSIPEDFLKSLGQEGKPVIRDLLADISQNEKCDGAISFWHETNEAGDETLVGVLFLPGAMEIFGTPVQFTFERVPITPQRDFWAAADEVARRLISTVVGVVTPPPPPPPPPPSVTGNPPLDFRSTPRPPLPPSSRVTSPPPPAPPSTAPSTGKLQITVQPGETIQDVAERCYGRRLLGTELLKINFLEPSDDIDDKVIFLPIALESFPIDVDKCKGNHP